MSEHEHDRNLVIGCPECGGGMRRDGAWVRCNGCDYAEGAVSYANRAEQFRRNNGGINAARKAIRKAPKRNKKAEAVKQRLRNPDLFGNVITGENGYRAVEAEVKRRAAIRETPNVIELGATRCSTCDRLYLVKNGMVICIVCGETKGPANAIGMLNRAFTSNEGA